MRYQAHNLLEEALEWAFLLSVAILSGPSGSGQAYLSKCCRQTWLLLWFQFQTEVYSLLSLGYFIHCGCYLVAIWLIIDCYLWCIWVDSHCPADSHCPHYSLLWLSGYLYNFRSNGCWAGYYAEYSCHLACHLAIIRVVCSCGPSHYLATRGNLLKNWCT